MLRVIKQGLVSCSDQVVKIPDFEPPIQEQHLQEEEEETVTVIDEEEEAKKAARIAEELARQRAIEKAEELSEKIIQNARLEKDKILEQAYVEKDELLRQVQQSGYQDAYGQLKEQITNCLDQVETVLDEMQQRQREFIQQYEQDLRFLAVDIAEKVLRKHISENETEMVEMVKQAVSTVKSAEWISVEVSDKLPKLVEQLKTEFAVQAGEKKIEVSAQDTELGSCVLNMPGSIVDVSLSAQLDNLRDVFREL